MYPIIDMENTGDNLKNMIRKAGYDVKYIQKYLHLSCPQPIYRWFKGKTLPSVDHLYALSILLGVHMEELVVQKQCTLYDIASLCVNNDTRRFSYYYEYLRKAA